MKIQLGTSDITNDLIYNKGVQDNWIVNKITFDPVAQLINQGSDISDADADANTDILNNFLVQAKVDGYEEVVIGDMDAYFYVTTPTSTGWEFDAALTIPSGLNLTMGVNTHLRTQPSDRRYTALLALRDKENITVKGGNLWGDRDQHNYIQYLYIDSAGSPTGGNINLTVTESVTYPSPQTIDKNIPITLNNGAINAQEIVDFINTDVDLSVDYLATYVGVVGDNIQFNLISKTAGNTFSFTYADVDSGATVSGSFVSPEWGHNVMIAGSNNITFDGVTTAEAMGDGIDIIRSNSGSGNRSYDVIIKDCDILRNRRQGVSITDGHDILLTTSNYTDSGVDMTYSKGTNPRFAIDLEPQFSESVEDVTISYNYESGSERGGIVVAKAIRTIIEHNDFETSMSFRESVSGMMRFNNIRGGGLVVGDATWNICTDNIAHDNTISNALGTGIVVGGYGSKVYDNTLTNCLTGMEINKSLPSTVNSEVYNNTITSNIAGSDGISFKVYIDDTDIYSNTVNVLGNAAPHLAPNDGVGQDLYRYSVRLNTFNGGAYNNISGIGGAFDNNDFDKELQFFSASFFTINNNRINSATSNAPLYVRTNNNNLTLTNNTLTNSSGVDCVNILDASGGNDLATITDTGNTCAIP